MTSLHVVVTKSCWQAFISVGGLLPAQMHSSLCHGFWHNHILTPTKTLHEQFLMQEGSWQKDYGFTHLRLVLHLFAWGFIRSFWGGCNNFNSQLYALYQALCLLYNTYCMRLQLAILELATKLVRRVELYPPSSTGSRKFYMELTPKADLGEVL